MPARCSVTSKIRSARRASMYSVREVFCLAVLAEPEVLNENIGKCPDLARREVGRAGRTT
jgi:hypothetical protein